MSSTILPSPYKSESMPILRAVPAIIFLACVVSGVELGVGADGHKNNLAFSLFVQRPVVARDIYATPTWKYLVDGMIVEQRMKRLTDE